MSSIDIGNKVKELMKKNKMTNLELAKLLNIEEQELSEKLSGKEEFLATEATKISNIFKIPCEPSRDIIFPPLYSIKLVHSPVASKPLIKFALMVLSFSKAFSKVLLPAPISPITRAL